MYTGGAGRERRAVTSHTTLSPSDGTVRNPRLIQEIQDERTTGQADRHRVRRDRRGAAGLLDVKTVGDGPAGRLPLTPVATDTGAPHNWDEARAYYHGEKPECAPHATAEERGRQFGTGSAVNEGILSAMRQGLKALQARDATGAAKVRDEVVRNITITYVQSAIKYSADIDAALAESKTDDARVWQAEGWALLPCDRAAHCRAEPRRRSSRDGSVRARDEACAGLRRKSCEGPRQGIQSPQDPPRGSRPVSHLLITSLGAPQSSVFVMSLAIGRAHATMQHTAILRSTICTRATKGWRTRRGMIQRP